VKQCPVGTASLPSPLYWGLAPLGDGAANPWIGPVKHALIRGCIGVLVTLAAVFSSAIDAVSVWLRPRAG
jgi:hypothetical protein